jgi:23S rRNA pseudouridine1911/1915/1917 synthase
MNIEIITVNNGRLDKLIAESSSLSREKISKLIIDKKCIVNGIVASKKSQIINADSKIILKLPSTKSNESKISLDYVFVDEDIIIINKPKNIIAHGLNNDHFGTINGIIIHDYPEIINVGDTERPGIVHRLDKGTSGLMIISRNQKSYEKLKDMILNREIVRNYTALIHGIPKRKEAIINAPIGRDPKNPLKRKVLSGGKESKTLFKTIRSYAEYTLVDIKLYTGRTHQIRVHFEELGHPIVGDKVYSNRISSLDRPFLHSSYLEFLHPIKKSKVKFSSKLPKDLLDYLDQINYE